MSRSRKIKKNDTNDNEINKIVPDNLSTNVNNFFKYFAHDEDFNKDKGKETIAIKNHTFYGDLKSGMNIHLIKNYLNDNYADKLFADLKKIQYNSDEDSMVRVMGVRHKIPRKQTAFGDPGATYHFSGITVAARDWTKKDNTIDAKVAQKLKCISDRAGRTAGATFNYALINNYLDNTNSIGYHSDDEKELGKYPIIAGISLGQERQIYFKSKVTGEVLKITLPHNSLVIMHYPTNKYWAHSIPKTTKKKGQRISLTFRSVNDEKLI